MIQAQKRFRAWIGLGSNLDNPLTQLRTALGSLALLPDTRITCTSSVYANPALTAPDDAALQPGYLNAVVGIDTELSPIALLDALQTIESMQGRVRTRHWGPRTIDLDLLLYGDEIIRTARLFVPHPGIRERAFVLVPLHEIAPELRLPDGTPLAQLLAACATGALRPLGALA